MEEKNKINKRFILSGVALIVILIIAGVFLMPSTITGFSVLDDQMAKVEIKTSKGDITIVLKTEEAPITTANFLKYVDEGYYDGLVFHRVIDGFMVQGGGFSPDGKEKATKAPIKLESDTGLLNTRGTLAMARTSNPDSATSQFFINSVDNDFLNYNTFNPGYAVFAEVVDGMDVVDAISKVKTGSRGPMQDWPAENVVIISMKRI